MRAASTRSVITGVGYALPKQCISNAEIAAAINACQWEPCDPAWIVQRTGIEFRHLVQPGETAATLGAAAARQALQKARLNADQVDEIIVATCTPDYRTPATASLIHHRLNGRAGIPCSDVNAACSGFLYALRQAHYIVQLEGKRVVVIGVDVLSSLTNPADRNIRPLLGDGAGAIVLERQETENGIMDIILGGDSQGHDLIKVPAGGSALPWQTPGLDPEMFYLRMDGRKVFQFATRIIAKVITDLTQRNGLASRDLDLLVPHQANWRILETAARLLRFPIDRVADTVRVCGNTSAASIPISLAMAVEQGKVQPGMLVALCAFGAGLTWGGALLRWGFD